MNTYQTLMLLALLAFLAKFIFTIYKARNINFWNFEQINDDLFFYGGVISALIVFFILSFFV